MKKILLAILSIVTLLLASSCFNKVTTYKDLSEKEVSKLVRRHITQDMTHEEIFAKLESLGFEKLWDINIVYGTKDVWPQVAYVMGDVKVITVLDFTLNVDYDYIFNNGGFNGEGYKSEYITVNGVGGVVVSWRKNDEYEISERVAKQRKLQSKIESNIKVGDDFNSVVETIEKLGFTFQSETELSYIHKTEHKYVKDKYSLTLTTSDSTNEVTEVRMYYSDVIFKNENKQN